MATSELASARHLFILSTHEHARQADMLLKLPRSGDCADSPLAPTEPGNILHCRDSMKFAKEFWERQDGEIGRDDMEVGGRGYDALSKGFIVTKCPPAMGGPDGRTLSALLANHGIFAAWYASV